MTTAAIPSHQAAIDSSQQVEAKATPDEILTNAYLSNGAIVVLTNAFQATLNRLMDNNDLSSGSKDNHFTSSVDVSFTHFNNKMVKGNWAEVDSNGKQLLALLGYTTTAALSDIAASLIPTKNGSGNLIGKTTALAAVNSITYLSAMSIGAVLGKKTFRKGAALTKVAATLAQKIGSIGLVGVASIGTALANRLFIDAKSSFGTVLNLVANEVVNKLFKTGQGSEKELSKKVKLLAAYCVVSIVADLLVGVVIPNSIPASNFGHYLSPTSVGAFASFAKISSKALLDDEKPETKKKDKQTYQLVEAPSPAAVEMVPFEKQQVAVTVELEDEKPETKKKDKQVYQLVEASSPTTVEMVPFEKQQVAVTIEADKQVVIAPVEVKKPVSKLRVISALVVTVATPIIVIASNHLAFTKESSTASFGIKLLQHNVNALAVRELFKCATGSAQRLAVTLIPPVLALGAEFAANYVDPAGPMLLPVTGIAIATAASYLGMTVSGKLFGRTEIDDD